MLGDVDPANRVARRRSVAGGELEPAFLDQ